MAVDGGDEISLPVSLTGRDRDAAAWDSIPARLRARGLRWTLQRRRLVEVLAAGGQSVITTTDLAHVPGAEDPAVGRLAIAEGAVLQAAA